MKRVAHTVRANQAARFEELGFDWDKVRGQTYWDESAAWELTEAEAKHLHHAGREAHDMLIDAIEQVITSRELPLYGFSLDEAAVIEQSWEDSDVEPTLFGRFDFAYDGVQARLLEYQGDNPGGLYETAMVQKQWLSETHPDKAQFNSLHEALLDMACNLEQLQRTRPRDLSEDVVTVTCLTPDAEAEGTAGYLLGVLQEAGLETSFVGLSEIGWSGDGLGGWFLDTEDRPITTLLRLAPLDWLLKDEFGPKLISQLKERQLRMIEPAWKLLASHKRLLTKLWDRYPYHPMLLNTATTPAGISVSGGYVKKPVTGREGQNITLYDGAGAVVSETHGNHGADLMVYQERARLAEADGNHAVMGVFVVGGDAVALGIRETSGPITDASARFLPHYLV